MIRSPRLRPLAVTVTLVTGRKARLRLPRPLWVGYLRPAVGLPDVLETVSALYLTPRDGKTLARINSARETSPETCFREIPPLTWSSWHLQVIKR
jgi:hypothetical protein